MKVARLIAALQKCDPKAQVFVNHDGEFCAEVKLEKPEGKKFQVALAPPLKKTRKKNVILLTLHGSTAWELPTEEE